MNYIKTSINSMAYGVIFTGCLLVHGLSFAEEKSPPKPDPKKVYQVMDGDLRNLAGLAAAYGEAHGVYADPFQSFMKKQYGLEKPVLIDLVDSNRSTRKAHECAKIKVTLRGQTRSDELIVHQANQSGQSGGDFTIVTCPKKNNE